MELRLLLRLWKRFGDEDAMQMARKTLDHMARGGLYDHLGGGFHRYSTDARWLAPHFEKMLYDNALLPIAYTEAYQATADPFYQQVVEETLAYVRREMTSPEGGFYSTQDADSEGEEGKFFVWSLAEVKQVLGEEDGDLFAKVYDVSPSGNWEGKNILNRNRSDEQDARMLKMDEQELRSRLASCREKLLQVRSQRIWPGRDEKILTSWNGLMISAFAKASQVFEKPEYMETAKRAADFLLERMRRPDGRVLRTYSQGSEPKLNAYLEDYSFVIDALVSLYEATFETKWIESALQMVDVMVDQFWDDADGGFFYTGRDHEQLIARTKDPHDSSIPSANSKAVTALLRLAKLTGRDDLMSKAEKTLHLFEKLLSTSPQAAGQMLIAMDFFLGPVQEFAVVGNPDDNETSRVIRAIRQSYLPNSVVAFKPTDAGEETSEVVPLLAEKVSDGKVATYLCQDFACQAPLHGAEAVEASLRS